MGWSTRGPRRQVFVVGVEDEMRGYLHKHFQRKVAPGTL